MYAICHSNFTLNKESKMLGRLNIHVQKKKKKNSSRLLPPTWLLQTQIRNSDSLKDIKTLITLCITM